MILDSWFFFNLVRTQLGSYTGKTFLAFCGFRLLAEAFTAGTHNTVGPSAIDLTDAS